MLGVFLCHQLHTAWVLPQQPWLSDVALTLLKHCFGYLRRRWAFASHLFSLIKVMVQDEVLGWRRCWVCGNYHDMRRSLRQLWPAADYRRNRNVLRLLQLFDRHFRLLLFGLRPVRFAHLWLRLCIHWLRPFQTRFSLVQIVEVLALWNVVRFAHTHSAAFGHYSGIVS
jgi:hypothetical protein